MVGTTLLEVRAKFFKIFIYVKQQLSQYRLKHMINTANTGDSARKRGTHTQTSGV